MTVTAAIQDYDNDQLDYLWRVYEGMTPLAEPWAVADGLVTYFEGRVALTPAGEFFVLSRDWVVLPRQIIDHEMLTGERDEPDLP